MSKKNHKKQSIKKKPLVDDDFKKNRTRANPNDRIEFTFFLKPKESGSPLTEEEHLYEVDSKLKETISRRAYNKHHKVHEDAFTKLKEFSHQHNFRFLRANEIERWANCKAKIKDIESAFGIDIKAARINGKTSYYYETEIPIPDDLDEFVESVSGIHSFPIKSHKIFPDEINVVGADLQGTAVKPQDFANLYNFPMDLDGSGQTIAIISMGGGYSPKVLKKYFDKIGIPMPDIKWTRVDGGVNNLKDKTENVYEVYMDIEVAGALAPGAKFVMYFANSKVSDFAKAIKKAIHDKRNRPSIISISWGGLEQKFRQRERDVLNRVFHEAAALNITVITSSGDLGSSGKLFAKDGELNVQLPASSPLVLSVGGTILHQANGVIVDEHCWEQDQDLDGWPVELKSGGGFSSIWPMPSYQLKAVPRKYRNKNKRGLPDVSANAATAPGILLQVGEKEQISMGTSAATPLWAALIARLNQRLNEKGLPNIGFINPLLYLDEVAKTFNPVDRGDNGAYKAEKGWDPTSGIGSPNGAELINAIVDIQEARMVME